MSRETTSGKIEVEVLSAGTTTYVIQPDLRAGLPDRHTVYELDARGGRATVTGREVTIDVARGLCGSDASNTTRAKTRRRSTRAGR